jgi:hypothetical protein
MLEESIILAAKAQALAYWTTHICYLYISINYGEVTMVLNDIFEVLRIRKVIELLQYFLITLHTLLVTLIHYHIEFEQISSAQPVCQFQRAIVWGYGLIVLIKQSFRKVLFLAAKQQTLVSSST